MDIDSSEEIWDFFSKYVTAVTSNQGIENHKQKTILSHSDLIGRKVKENHQGLVLRLYSDGSVEKIINISDYH